MTTKLPEQHEGKNTEEVSAERDAQVNCVLGIINDAIEKLKISLILPRIFENPLTVHQFLIGTKYEHCFHAVVEFLRERKKFPSIDGRSVTRFSHSLIKIIDLFQENHEMKSLMPAWLDELSSEDKSLLEAFRLLYTITDSRLHKSALSELAKEKKIHTIYHENEQMKKHIVEFQNKMRNQKINLRWKLASKDAVIRKYEEDLALKKWNNNVRIKQEIVKSSRRIRQLHQASASRQRELEEELEKTKAAYEKMVRQNLYREKEVRDEKNKLLMQLQSLVRRFDQTIGDKITENLYLQEEYDEQKRQFDIFLIEYQREEAEYEVIVTEREAQERRIFEEKLMLFMMNRSARIIQRWWRKLQREARKKAKKGGKGKGRGKGKK